jgi:MFS transporter, DHA2 family, metal-tetracycline-proton antiporter
LSSVFAGPIAGRLADRKGNRFVVAIGLSFLLSGILFLSFMLGVAPLAVASSLFLIYIGFSLFQTAMINSVSQTLSIDETGAGMGVFNLVSIISGAVGTALVGKILDGKWFEFTLLPRLSDLNGDAYSNILLAFSLVVVLGAAVYFRSNRGERGAAIRSEVNSEPTRKGDCAEECA